MASWCSSLHPTGDISHPPKALLTHAQLFSQLQTVFFLLPQKVLDLAAFGSRAAFVPWPCRV